MREAAAEHGVAPQRRPVHGAHLPPIPEVDAYIDEVRQDYLDALPIAAAILVDGERDPAITTANRQFMALAIGTPGGTLANAVVAAAAREFVADDLPAVEFEWNDVEEIDGHHFCVRFARLPLRAGKAGRSLITLVDRTAEIETERNRRADMLHDSLTGLPNRASFAEAVNAAIAADGGNGHLAVLVVDITRFSRINESMGPQAGDELIVTVARRLDGALRGSDMLARLGGDEFAVLLAIKEGPGDVLHAARRIRSVLAAPFRLSEVELLVDGAIGCALMGERVRESKDLVRNAQFALKRAKQSGRIEVYQPGEMLAARMRFNLETELRRAIEQDELTLAFQPLVDLRSGLVSGFEALARWRHAERGVIPPAEFIPLAEESGSIVPLGRWALDTATCTLAEWDRKRGTAPPTNMSVNLSAIQLARDDVGAAVAGALARSGIAGDRLTIELTESAIVRDPERAFRVLSTLKELRARIAMDDFGTGYSSLASLQRLPIDQLKIDRSFVTGMMGDRDSVAIVRAVLGLATALGMETTAEGVETFEVAQMLAALGCSTGQGFYFARPLDADAALRYWLDRNA